MDIQETHSLLRSSVLDLIELHQDKPVHLVVHALISVGAKLARDSAPTEEDAEKLIQLALTEDKA